MNVGSEQHRRDHGEPLHDLVLVVGDLGLVVVAHAGDQVARRGRARRWHAAACRRRRRSAARCRGGTGRRRRRARRGRRARAAPRRASARASGGCAGCRGGGRRCARGPVVGGQSSTLSSSSSISSSNASTRSRNALGDLVDQVVHDHARCSAAPCCSYTRAALTCIERWSPGGVFRTDTISAGVMTTSTSW